MALFGASPRDYNSIVAPLKRIEGDLNTYIKDQGTEVSSLEDEKKTIDFRIGVATTEIKKSTHTATKISELLGTDFDGDGVADFVEPVTEDTPTPKDDE